MLTSPARSFDEIHDEVVDYFKTRPLLEYHNSRAVNVIPKKTYEHLVLDVFSTVAEVLSKSYGPLGSTTTISQGRWSIATKDGFAIFKNLIFNNKFKTMVYSLMQETCSRLNNTVGDGTTTAILLAAKLFEAYQNHKEEIDAMYLLPREFNAAWESIIDELTIKIQESGDFSMQENPNDTHKIIKDIALVASNGTESISDEVAKIYAKTPGPMIKVKDSPTSSCYMSEVNGFDFPTNLIGKTYAHYEDLSTEEENIRVLVFAIKVDDEVFEKIIRPINDIYRLEHTKILVVAPSYDTLLINRKIQQYCEDEYRQLQYCNLILTKYTSGNQDPHQLEDLGIMLGCQVIEQPLLDLISKSMTPVEGVEPDAFHIFRSEDQFGIIGTAPKASMSMHNGSVFKDIEIDNSRYEIQLKKAKDELEELKNKMAKEGRDFSLELSQAQSRISRLEMKNYIYYVGADSKLSASILKDMADDVIKACASAYKHGIIPGCQLTIIEAARDGKKVTDVKLEKMIFKMIEEATTELYRMLINGPTGIGFDRIRNIRAFEYGSLTDDEIFNRILELSLKSMCVFDLTTLVCDDVILTSVETDVNVLRAASDICKLLIGGNQFVFRDTELDNQQEVQI